MRWDDAFFGARLLDAATVREMTTPPQLPGDAQSNYAMGWLRDELDGHPMIWHNGAVIGAHGGNAYFPDQRISVVVLGNSSSFDETRIRRAAFRALVPPSEAQLAARPAIARSRPRPASSPAITAAAKAEYERWRAGDVDPARYSAPMRARAEHRSCAKFAPGLRALGTPSAFVYRGKQAAAEPVHHVVLLSRHDAERRACSTCIRSTARERSPACCSSPCRSRWALSSSGSSAT